MKNKLLIRAAVMLGVCMATLLIATPAMAMWSWCDCDPVVNIAGHTVSIDAGLQGDPQQIRGDIVFTVTLPKGTQFKVISCEPNAEVKVSYNNSCNSWDDNKGCDDNGRSPSWRTPSRSIPVEVSVDINTKTTFNTRLTITLDGKQVAQEYGTTRHDLECDFTIR